jgi:hypothetical protein
MPANVICLVFFISSNKQLASHLLMHSLYCGSAVYPYQVLERRQPQEMLICCAGLHNKKYLQALNTHSVQWKEGTFKRM